MMHFANGDIRQYLLQFVRMFGSFSVQKGYDDAGNPVYESVPARYGDYSRQTGHILKENSENKLNTVPIISCYVNSLSMNPDLRRYPQFQQTLPVIEKKFNQDTHEYENEPGASYNVTRYQPVPYELRMNVDIWTSNTDQKLQLLEQILVLFNPTVNLYKNENVLDWTSLAYCELVDTNWSSRSLPGGADNIIDVSTLQFRMPIFINPPAKVERMNIIQTILTQIHTVGKDDLDSWTIDNNNSSTGYVITTLDNYAIRYEDNEITLLDSNATANTELDWKTNVFSKYGELRPGISQMRLRLGNDVADSNNDVIGTITYHPALANKLIFTVDTDTLPAITKADINAVINPHSSYPGDGALPAAISGQRYLILDDLPQGGIWGSVNAKSNDIIEYNGSDWIISYDASANTGPDYVTNITTNDQFEWTGEYWQNSNEGVYRHGWFRLYV